MDSFAGRRLDLFKITDDKRAEVSRLIPYWKGKTNRNLCMKLIREYVPEGLSDHYNYDQCNINQVLSNLYHTITGDGHIIADYKRFIEIGAGGLKQEAEERLLQEDDTNKINFLKSVIISMDAVIAFARRYADLAEKLAEYEKNADRKKELQEIARICRKVPEHKADTFWEALQSFWFAHLIIQIESNGQSISFGRFDQIMNPYYQADKANNHLEKETAIELVQCFFLKAMEINKVRDWGSTEFNTGYAMYQTLTLGGQDSEGHDATNDMTYITLEATADLKVPEPTTIMRVHKGTPPELFEAAVKALAEHKGGLPSFFNDEVAIPMLMSQKYNEITLEDARNWAVMGCVEPTVPGKYITSTGGTCTLNLAKLFELALFQGKNPVTGEIVFEPKHKEITNFEEMWAAYQEQLEFYLDIIPYLMKVTCEAYRELAPTPFLSALISDRIQQASDVMDGKGPNDYNVELMELHGLGTVVDALAAVKIAVFEQKKYTIEELRKLLSTNYEGRERDRLYLKNKVAKYGNDICDVDAIAKRIVDMVSEHMSQYKTPRGGCYGISTQTTTCNVPDGRNVGATPDGRLAFEPLSDNHSPSPAADRRGPTAAMKSVASTNHYKLGMGPLYNMKFAPMQFETEEGRAKFADLIRGYFAHGGYQVQFNVISNELLKEAQLDPIKHRDLIVKVAGYSARFTDLDRKLQDQLIARTLFQA